MANQVVEGTWEQIALHAGQLSGRRVRLTILDGEPPDRDVSSRSGAPGAMIQRGMFPQLKGLTEEDFKRAEWRGEDPDKP